MAVKDNIGIRMKGYEQIAKFGLIRRMPVAIRIDGRAFHTFTRGMQKPFDKILIQSMQETMKYLCENIQNCVIGYTQSDEITLIMIDYKELNTSAWFDNEVQKICSISASMATMAFNRAFEKNVSEWGRRIFIDHEEGYTDKGVSENLWNLLDVYKKAIEKGAMFDSRCFNIPKEEVTNLIYWRQLDATRNSIQMVAQANFSHKELQGMSCNALQNKLLTERDINWNDFPTTYKRGSCCVRNSYAVGTQELPSGLKIEKITIRDMTQSQRAWIIDNNIPIFKGEGREYINILVGL